MAYPTTGAKTNYAETAVGTWRLTDGAVTRPTAWYIALYTTLPGEDGTGGVEVSGNGYARQPVDWSETATPGQFDNDALVAFTADGGNWGSIVGWGNCDHVSAGNIWDRGELDAAETINDGDTLSFAAGALKISED